MVFTEKKRWPFFGLPWTFTTYTVAEDLITVKSGFLRQTENDCYMYRIVDVQLETGLLERIFGLGTVRCFSGDVTDPDLRLQHIRNAKEIKDYILKQSEEERLRRKTLTTQSLDGRPGPGSLDDGPDFD